MEETEEEVNTTEDEVQESEEEAYDSQWQYFRCKIIFPYLPRGGGIKVGGWGENVTAHCAENVGKWEWTSSLTQARGHALSGK